MTIESYQPINRQVNNQLYVSVTNCSIAVRSSQVKSAEFETTYIYIYIYVVANIGFEEGLKVCPFQHDH